MLRKIISIHGVPRSGTTWLGQIFDSSPNTRHKIQPLFSYAFKNRIGYHSSKEDIKQFYSELYSYDDDFLDQTLKKQQGIHPIFPKKQEKPEFLVIKMVRSHFIVPYLLENVSNLKVICIVRNPCGVLSSWRKASKEFQSNWNFEEEWRFAQSKNNFRPEEYFGFHRWMECTKLFLELEKTSPERVTIIRYEDLVNSPFIRTKQLFDFTGIDFDSQTKQFLQDSTSIYNSDSYSVFKGGKAADDWKSFLEPHIIRQVYNLLEDTEFDRFL